MSADTGLFALAEKRLEWIDQRQRVLAQNIANSDTPGYQPRDLAPFSNLLDATSMQPVRTSPMHLVGMRETGAASAGSLLPAERSPDGNAVSPEQQLAKVADDEAAQAVVGNLWKSYMGMYMTALGHG